MKMRTVYLPTELSDRLERAARESGKSKSALVRAGVEDVVEVELTPLPRAPLWHGSGNLAEHVDEIPGGFGQPPSDAD